MFNHTQRDALREAEQKIKKDTEIAFLVWFAGLVLNFVLILSLFGHPPQYVKLDEQWQVHGGNRIIFSIPDTTFVPTDTLFYQFRIVDKRKTIYDGI